MNAFLENLLERPTKQKIAMFVGMLSVILGGFWFMGFGPVYEELSRINNDIHGTNGLKVQIAAEEAIAENLPKFEKEVARLDIELKKALLQLPNEKEIDHLLAQVSDLGRDAGLDIRLFKPDNERKKDYYAEVPVQLEVAGTYHQIATFFDEVGHMDRIVNLAEFTLLDPRVQEEEVTLKSTVVATTFRFLDESERIELEKANNKKGGRKRAKKAVEDDLT